MSNEYTSGNQIDPIKALENLARDGILYGQAKANRIALEDFRKTLKARLMRAAEEQGVKSLQAQERDAYADLTYEQHLQVIRSAVEEEERLRWRLESARAAVDVWRSLESSNRTLDRSAS